MHLATHTVTSADGTTIAFDRLGDGPPLIMVVGAFNTRATTEPVAAALQDRFTVLNYDRRGRGDSGDTPPYAVEREVEDLEALTAQAGGSSAVLRPSPRPWSMTPRSSEIYDCRPSCSPRSRRRPWSSMARPARR
jgi:hypothetical protein